jgi:uncharacterized protein (DUF885 family)
MKRALGIAALVALLLGGWHAYRLVWGVPLNINHFADRSSIKFLLEFPELLTMLGAADNTVLDFHSHRFSDLSPAGDAHRQALVRKVRDQLAAYDNAELEGQQALTRSYLHWAWLERHAPGRFPYHFSNIAYNGPYPINQTAGAQEVPLEVLTQYQRIEDEDSAMRFLERMGATPIYLGNLAAGVEARAEMGVLPPQVVLERLITRAEALLEQSPEEWAIIQAFASQLAATDLDESRQQALLDRGFAQLELVVIPAYEDYLDFLRELAVNAPATVGVWALPDGEAYYQALLEFYTTTSLTAADIHQLGLARVAEIGREMDAALAALGYVEGSRIERLQALAAERPPADSAEDVLAQYRQETALVEEGIAPAFAIEDIAPLDIRPVPEEMQIGAPFAYYFPPALDGSRPGYFYVNLVDLGQHEPFSMRTLVAHEAIPGHHYQASAGQQARGLPMVRRSDVIGAYSEGWALYAERLVGELGLHDPDTEIGRLQAEMFRAVRLVVDTGIHHYRWTREQAIEYMLAETGRPRVDVVSEIERYIAMPGQATAYMVGMLEILEMREQARLRQGERFSLPAFHDVVLKNGALPLSVLKSEVERQLN